MARERQGLPPVGFKDGERGSVPSGISTATVAALKGHFGDAFQFFAMQSSVISHLLHAGSIQQPGDVILRSPTGSGKTLAYVIPIIERLATRSIPRLRAVIIVPTHDLAVQVHSIFRLFQSSADNSSAISVVLATGATRDENVAQAEVLIATPGTLLDHVENTPGVSLAYVEFLVLDESDRLLADAFYDWADVVLPRCGMMHDDDGETYSVDNRIGPCSGVLALGIPATATGNLHASRRTVLTRKILVSATATRDPQRIAKLDLRRITYFEPFSTKPGNDDLHSSYAVPSGLSEFAYVLESAQQKPMALLSILGWNPTETPETFASPLSLDGSKLIFTKSVESAHRLSRLLELFAWKQSVPPIVVEISRHVTPERRENILALLRGQNDDGRPVVVVCSDVFARGIDIPSVEAIINYDVPPRVRNYLHRVGRTARAGRSGIAVTLLLKTQVRHFKGMVKDLDRQSGDGDKRKCKIKDKSLDTLQKVQQVAILAEQLNAVKRILRRESLGLIVPGECLPSHVLAEMNLDFESMMKEVEQKRSANGNNIGNRPPAKRARVEGNEDVDEVMDHGEELPEDGEDDIDSGVEDDIMGVEDSFQDLITAHVAYNWTRSIGGEKTVENELPQMYDFFK